MSVSSRFSLSVASSLSGLALIVPALANDGDNDRDNDRCAGARDVRLRSTEKFIRSTPAIRSSRP